MANQTSVNPDLASMEPSPGSMVGNIAEFGNDIATLVELQAKLAMYDSKECIKRVTIPLIVLVAGLAIVLSCLPILLLGLADLLTELTGLRVWACRLIVPAVAMTVAGLVGLLSLREASGSISSFRRSSEEFTRNLSWVRTVLVHSGRAVSRPKI